MQRFALALLLLLGGCWEVSAQGSKPSFITREVLELRLKALERDRNQAIANVNAYDGAIQECKFWLELLKDQEQKEEAMEYYPSWRYHKEKKPVLVNNAEEDEALGPGWADSPAAFKRPEEPAPQVVDEGVFVPDLEDDEPEEKPKRKKKSK